MQAVMRAVKRTGALLIVLVLANHAHAQSGASGIWGAPRDIQFKPIDTSKTVVPTNVNKVYHTPGNVMNTNASGSNFLRKISLGAWPPTAPTTSVLPQSQNQFQPKTPKGGITLSNYLPGFMTQKR